MSNHWHAKRPLSLCLAFFVLLLVAAVGGGAPALAQTDRTSDTAPGPSAGRISIGAGDLTLALPGGWTGRRHSNIETLYAVPPEQFAGLSPTTQSRAPRITVETDQRDGRADALRRLLEIQAEHTEPTTWMTIAGWPALTRRHLQQRPRPGEGTGPIAGADMVLVVTTAAAVGARVVRFEAWLPAEASEELIRQVETVAASLTAPAPADSAQIERELQMLRSGSIPGLPLSILPPSLLESGTPATSSPQLQPDLLDSGSSDPAQSGAAGEADQTTMGEADDALATAEDAAGASVRIATDGGRDSEISIAVSGNGRNVVIGTNNNWHYSTNAGQTWQQSNLGRNGNDPSVAWGPSGGANGTFYAANIASPSTEIRASTNAGATFAFRANAYTCGQGGDPACAAAFPDQEHIAADRFNVTANGDQVYSVWRHLDGNWGIVCSRDSGQTWSTNAFFSAGDFPRVAVGQDGFAYVTYLNGGNINLRRFNSCEANQNPMVAGPVRTVVAGHTAVACPTPGLDRCNLRNTLASPEPAVDDLDPAHVYVAYAVNTNPGGGGSPTCNDQNTCNENIIVQDSTDSGATWNAGDPNRAVRISSGIVARRFMPWVCSVGGAAYVTWYDRRAAFPGGTTVSNNSLTDFFASSASRNVLGNLAAGAEFKVNNSGTTDAQCEAGFPTGSLNSWPGVVDQQGDSESCSVQPQLGGFCCEPGEIDGSGRCLTPSAASSQQACDFNQTACPGAEQCAANRGSPKYGDYNGAACGAGRVYMTWASATAPAAVPASADIDAFFASKVVCCAPQIQVPGPIAFANTCLGESGSTTMNVCNTGKADLEVESITSSNPQFAVTAPSAGYPVVISPDSCFPFQVTFTPTSAGSKNATLTIASNDPINPTIAVNASGDGAVQDVDTSIAGSGNFGDVCVGTFKDLDLTIHNSGGCPLTVTGIDSTNGAEFKVAGVVNFPLVIGPGGSTAIPIRFEPAASSLNQLRNASIRVFSDDPDTPIRLTAVQGFVAPGDVRVTGSTDFGLVCGGAPAEKTVSVCNVGACNLNVTSVAFDPACADFTLVNNPFPAPVSPDSCQSVVVRYTPTTSCALAKSCNLRVVTDDPDSPVINLAVTASTPCASIDVPPDQSFPPEVVGTIGACETALPFPVSNTGQCNLAITSMGITANSSDFSETGVPSFPIILQPGHVAGEGDLRNVFGPDLLTTPTREHQGQLTVTYVSDPVLGTTTDVTRNLCGEGVNTGARVLVRQAGVPLAKVDRIQIQRINANRNRQQLDTVDTVRNVALTTVDMAAPCTDFQFHREYGTVSNPIQLLPGSYQVTASATLANGKKAQKTVGFDVQTCDFNPTVIIDF